MSIAAWTCMVALLSVEIGFTIALVIIDWRRRKQQEEIDNQPIVIVNGRRVWGEE